MTYEKLAREIDRSDEVLHDALDYLLTVVDDHHADAAGLLRRVESAREALRYTLRTEGVSK